MQQAAKRSETTPAMAISVDENDGDDTDNDNDDDLSLRSRRGVYRSTHEQASNGAGHALASSVRVAAAYDIAVCTVHTNARTYAVVIATRLRAITSVTSR